jgi:hypothetical protein
MYYFVIRYSFITITVSLDTNCSVNCGFIITKVLGLALHESREFVLVAVWALLT